MNRRGSSPLATPLALSIALHFLAAAVMLFVRGTSHSVQPIPYRINLVAGPRGERAEGVFTESPKVATPPPPKVSAPIKNEKSTATKSAKLPTPKPPAAQKATPTPDRATTAQVSPDKNDTPPDTKNTSPPKAGGGAVGGKGTHVTTLTRNGKEFPDQLYLDNLVSRVITNFDVPKGSQFTAIVTFTLGRNGCLVGDPKMDKSSPSPNFDSAARRAVYISAQDCGFKPLPAAWEDDILTIRFTFDPSIIK